MVTFVPLLRKEAEILASKCEKNLKAIICFREREASERCKDSVKMLFKDRQDIRDRLDLPDIVKKHSST